VVRFFNSYFMEKNRSKMSDKMKNKLQSLKEGSVIAIPTNLLNAAYSLAHRFKFFLYLHEEKDGVRYYIKSLESRKADIKPKMKESRLPKFNDFGCGQNFEFA